MANSDEHIGILTLKYVLHVVIVERICPCHFNAHAQIMAFQLGFFKDQNLYQAHRMSHTHFLFLSKIKTTKITSAETSTPSCQQCYTRTSYNEK